MKIKLLQDVKIHTGNSVIYAMKDRYYTDKQVPLEALLNLIADGKAKEIKTPATRRSTKVTKTEETK